MAEDLPTAAAWKHGATRTGLEATSFERSATGWRATGSTTAIEAGLPWWVSYQIDLTEAFTTRAARVTGRQGRGPVRSVTLEADGQGHWRLDGRPAKHLTGCLDVDLESSAFTNTLPVRRAAGHQGERFLAPAVFVRVDQLRVERLDQDYKCLGTGPGGSSFDYGAPTLGFTARIRYDADGLVAQYPGIADRVW